MSEPAVLLNAAGIHRALARIAHEIAERNEQSSEVILVGIQSGGVLLARQLSLELRQIWGHDVPVGSLDIAMHRDDLHHRIAPVLHATDIPFDITDRTVVIVDDVLFSGRTTRAALDALNDLGRPRQVQLAVLVDRGHRELPIRADFVGKNVPTSRQERVNVRLGSAEGEDGVFLEKP